MMIAGVAKPPRIHGKREFFFKTIHINVCANFNLNVELIWVDAELCLLDHGLFHYLEGNIYAGSTP